MRSASPPEGDRQRALGTLHFEVAAGLGGSASAARWRHALVEARDRVEALGDPLGAVGERSGHSALMQQSDSRTRLEANLNNS